MRSTHVLVAGLAAAMAGCSARGPVVVSPGPDASIVTARGVAHGEPIGIPPGHLPPPGECRIWIPGVPPGQQGPPGGCSALEARVPPGAWLVHRPGRDRDEVAVSVYDEARPGLVLLIRTYDFETGRLLRERRPGRR